MQGKGEGINKNGGAYLGQGGAPPEAGADQ